MYFAAPLFVAFRPVLANLPQFLLGSILDSAIHFVNFLGNFLGLFSQSIARGRHTYSFQKKRALRVTIEQWTTVSAQGRAAGGFSPVCLTSFSVVTVVCPPGVEVTVSVFVFDSSLAQPTMPMENKLSIKAAQTIRFFMSEISF
jgi:hypothetical protein